MNEMKELIKYLSLPELSRGDFEFVRITGYYDGILSAECMYLDERAWLSCVYDGHNREDDCEWMEYDRRTALWNQMVGTTTVEWHHRVSPWHTYHYPRNKITYLPNADTKAYWAIARKWKQWPSKKVTCPVARFSFHPSPHLRRGRSIRYWKRE